MLRLAKLRCQTYFILQLYWYVFASSVRNISNYFKNTEELYYLPKVLPKLSICVSVFSVELRCFLEGLWPLSSNEMTSVLFQPSVLTTTVEPSDLFLLLNNTAETWSSNSLYVFSTSVNKKYGEGKKIYV